MQFPSSRVRFTVVGKNWDPVFQPYQQHHQHQVSGARFRRPRPLAPMISVLFCFVFSARNFRGTHQHHESAVAQGTAALANAHTTGQFRCADCSHLRPFNHPQSESQKTKTKNRRKGATCAPVASAPTKSRTSPNQKSNQR